VSDGKRLNTKASGIVSAAVMCSRVLGLVREVLFNSLFGTAAMGLFLIAFRIPNLLRDLFAEGALSSAFVTVFSQRIEREGEDSAWRLAAKMMTLTAVFMSGISVLGIVFSGQLVELLASGFSVEDTAFTILLTQIMYPFILLVSLAALVMGMLNSRNIFTMPALASSFFNIGSILGGTLAGWLIDPHFGKNALLGLAAGTLLGGFLQFAIQLPNLRRAGFCFLPDFRWRDPGMRKILVLMVPSVIAASAVQINVLINTGFAASLGSDAVTWLNSAFRLMQLPIGIFGVAIATVTLPVVSRIAASEDTSSFGPTLGKALRLTVFLTLPSAVGLWFLAEPIIGMIYEHGRFIAHDTRQTAMALQLYAIGLASYSCIKVLSPAFAAINRKWTPMFVGFGSIVLSASLNYYFMFHLGLGHRGLALATSLASVFNLLALYFLMLKPAGTLETGRFLGAIVRCTLGAVCLALVCVGVLSLGRNVFPNPSLWQQAVIVFATIAAASTAYLVACLVLRVEEVAAAMAFIQAKLSRLRGKLARTSRH